MKQDLRERIFEKIKSAELGVVELERCAISFLVDALPLRYYQAELLLHSLLKNTSVKKENILVHCTERVDQKFMDYLKAKQIAYQKVSPYLDGKYCNKLTQLESFIGKEEKYEGVLLLDADTFFLADPLIENKEYIAGKIVDAPNPPLKVLENIYQEANLNLPHYENTDWIVETSQTISGNFNGGFYYIPSSKISTLNRLWRKWAEWLYLRTELFEKASQAIHVDQISMSMAIAESGIATTILASNENCPIHSNKTLRLLDEKRNITMLHYHREVTPFGLLNSKKTSHPSILNAIEKANHSIVDLKESSFYELYRKSLLKVPVKPNNFEEVEKKIESICSRFPKKIKLILHAGTPKTGTTSLQFYWDKEKDELLKYNILYAKRDTSSFAPKHQWIVSTLKQNNFFSFLENFEDALVEYTETIDTIIFSTEGIYNHWWDYSLEAKYFLKTLADYFNFELWIWFRDPLSFTESLYRQYLKNPRMGSIKCYGKDLSLDAMLEDEWFSGHLDYLGFLQETQELFSKENVKIFSMQKDVVLKACNALDIPINLEHVIRHNEKLNCTLIEVLRIFNRFKIPLKEKEKLVEKLYQLESEFGDFLDQKKVCNGKISYIIMLCTLQASVLKKQYHLSFSKER